MDSYFKAAVSDLDKLLDEFEENTDEFENSKAVDTHDSKRHLLSSELDYQQPKFSGSAVQESVRNTVSDELSLSTQTANVVNFEQLNSEQNEKNVTGLDLLSMVDSSSDKSQSSCLGRCIVPVCDLISDTGNLNHAKNNSECIQKLQPTDSQCSLSFTGFDLAPVPAIRSKSSADFIANLDAQQQSDEDTVLCSVEYNAGEKQKRVALRTGSPSEANVVDFDRDQEKTETLKNNEVLGQTNAVVDLKRIPALTIQQTSTVLRSKDELKCNELPCEPARNKNGVKSQENGKHAISNEQIESLVSDIPKIYQLNENSSNLPKEENFSESSLQTNDVPTLDKTYSTEEKLCNPEENASTTSSVVSAPEVSEDIQSSLSCLPLAVSICGKLVVNDDTNGKTPPVQATEVSSDITVHNEKYNDNLSKGELFERQGASEQDENLNRKSQLSLVKPSFTDSEMVGFGNLTTECEPFQHKDGAGASSSSVENTETCSNDLLTDIGERGLIDLSLEEDIVGSDVLISDAELDAFLSEYCCEEKHSKPLKEDTDDGLLESDVINDNVRNTNKQNVGIDRLPAERECEKIETSIDNNCILSNPESRLGILVGKSPQWKNLKTQKKHTVEKSEGTADCISQIETSDLTESQQMTHSGGARPKQLLNLPPSAICPEVTNQNILMSESQLTGSLVTNNVSDAKSSSDSVIKSDNIYTQSGFKDKRDSISPVITEPVTGVEQVIALGQKQPSWVPDSEAPNCMNCQAKFTFTKRRHHCRACGKVFCASCCNRKCKLQYLDKEARVCIGCYESINKAQALERMMSPTGSASPSISESPTVDVLQEAQPSGVYPKEQRRVWFADGILPNGEVADTTKLSSGVRRTQQEPYPVESPANDSVSATEKMAKVETPVTGQTEILCCPNSVLPEEDIMPIKENAELPCSSDCIITAVAEIPTVSEPARHLVAVIDNESNDVPASPFDYQMLCGVENHVSKNISLIPEDDGLPPLLFVKGEKAKESLVEEHPSHEEVTFLLEESNPLTFILNANLLVNVKLVSYCSERCWYFSTNGLHSLGQAEIIILLLHLPNENGVPKEIFQLFINIYKDAMKGRFIGNLENITFTEGFLGSKEHGGFLFITPTFQKLDDLMLPKAPFVCGILMQKQEVPWAKMFPMRLMLRLGAEYGVYPTPLTSIRHRKPLFGEIGHTLMNLLVDLRNYQYTMLTIDNLVIHMEMGKSSIKIPLSRYSEVMKIINTSNEHVISIGANFSSEADSHLVCIQNDDGVYQTQANSATGEPRKITGASFVVFNGSLKMSSGFLAKSSIVEDGIMVQITPEMMDGLRQALKEKKDFRITCGKVDSEEMREYVDICWVENEEKTNVSVTSPVDGKSMEGVQSKKIVQEESFEMDEKCIKCTEVFYLLKTELSSHAHRFAKEIAQALCTAFCPHLKTLKSNGMNKIGLRVSVDTDMVEYQAGSEGQLLPQHYLNDLDSALIPVIHGGTSNTTNLPLEIELIFFITESLLV